MFKIRKSIILETFKAFKMNKLETIGSSVKINFPRLGLNNVPARVDTGAKTSAIWATIIKEEDNLLYFTLFADNSPHYLDLVYITPHYRKKRVRSTSGITERRYVVKLVVEINGRFINASFTLANRHRQVYPILIGRNILRGKYIVDIKHRKTIKSVKNGKN